MQKLTDVELVELARKNNDAAMTVLMERYKSKVVAVCRSYFLIGGESEDLLQEGMIAIFNAINSYNGQASFSVYAITCVKNRIISVIKRYNNLKNKPLNGYISLSGYSDSDNDKTSVIIDGNFGPEESYINEESIFELQEKIKNSLSKYENSILTHYLKGVSHEEIAKITGKKTKSIYNAIQRIRNKLSLIILK